MMKDLLTKEQKIIKKYFRNDNFLRIFSFLMALAFFISINGVIGYDSEVFHTTEYIENIPLDVVYDEGYVVTGYPEEISATITGTKSNVQAAMNKKDTITATLELPIESEGIKTINLNQMLEFNYSGDVNIKPTIEEIELDVQKKITRELPIQVDYVGSQSISKGYILKQPELSRDTIIVEGGSQEINSIEKVVALVDLNELEDAKTKEEEIEAPIVVYDNKGQVVDVETNFETINITQPFEIATTIVEAEYQFIGKPDNKYISFACQEDQIVECEDNGDIPITTELYGEQDEISKIDKVEYVFDLSGIKDDEAVVTGSAVLPPNVFTTEPTKTIKIKLDKGKSKTIDNVQIRKENLNSIYSVIVEDLDSATISITVTGADSVIDSFDEDDISLYVDLTDIEAAGVYELPILYSTNQYVDVELSDEKVKLNIEEKE